MSSAGLAPDPAPSPTALPPAREFTWQRYDAELAAATADALMIVDGMSETSGRRRPAPGRWSVAECLAHLSATTHVYLPPLDDAVRRGHAAGVVVGGPFRPGAIGRWLISAMEPPPRRPMRSQQAILPPPDVALAHAVEEFVAAQDALRARVAAAAGLNLGRVRLRSPLMPLLRLSLGTCLGVLAAHERRHLWQARRVREALRAPGVTLGQLPPS